MPGHLHCGRGGESPAQPEEEEDAPGGEKSIAAPIRPGPTRVPSGVALACPHLPSAAEKSGASPALSFSLSFPPLWDLGDEDEQTAKMNKWEKKGGGHLAQAPSV